MQKFTMAVGDKVMYKTTIKTTYNEKEMQILTKIIQDLF